MLEIWPRINLPIFHKKPKIWIFFIENILTFNEVGKCLKHHAWADNCVNHTEHIWEPNLGQNQPTTFQPRV